MAGINFSDKLGKFNVVEPRAIILWIRNIATSLVGLSYYRQILPNLSIRNLINLLNLESFYIMPVSEFMVSLLIGIAIKNVLRIKRQVRLDILFSTPILKRPCHSAKVFWRISCHKSQGLRWERFNGASVISNLILHNTL